MRSATRFQNRLLDKLPKAASPFLRSDNVLARNACNHIDVITALFFKETGNRKKLRKFVFALITDCMLNDESKNKMSNLRVKGY